MTERIGLNCQRDRKRLQTEQDDFVDGLRSSGRRIAHRANASIRLHCTPVAFVARVGSAESQMGSADDLEAKASSRMMRAILNGCLPKRKRPNGSPQLRFTEKSDEVKPRAAQQRSAVRNMDTWLNVELVTAHLLTHVQPDHLTAVLQLSSAIFLGGGLNNQAKA